MPSISPPFRIFLAALALALLPPALLPIRAAEPTPLTLEEALRIAERQNPDLAAARAAAEASRARADASDRTLWPRLGLLADWSGSDNPGRIFVEKMNRGEVTASDFDPARLTDPGFRSHLTTVLSAEAPLDLFGKIRTASAGFRLASDASGADSEERGQSLRFDVVRAWYQASVARRAVEVSTRAVAQASARESEMTERVRQGAALEADLLRVRARRRSFEGDLVDRRMQADLAEAELGRLLGVASGERVVPAPPPPPKAEPPAGELAGWLEAAEANRPALLAARLAAEASGRAARAEAKGMLPDLSLGAFLQDDRRNASSGLTSSTIALTLHWSPFDPTLSSRRIAAESASRSSAESARSAAGGVRLDVERAWLRTRSTRERLAATAGGAEEGREALRIVRERRLAGMATLTDELETELASLAAELEEQGAAAAVAIADADLLRAAGRLRLTSFEN
jgi:OMF family outer membrane factor